jgi:hypothetical protein
MYAVAASVVVMMGLFVSQFNSINFEEYNHENAYGRSEADATLKKAEIALMQKYNGNSILKHS